MFWHELVRAVKVIPLEFRARWHARQAVKHREALDKVMAEARILLADRW